MQALRAKAHSTHILKTIYNKHHAHKLKITHKQSSHVSRLPSKDRKTSNKKEKTEWVIPFGHANKTCIIQIIQEEFSWMGITKGIQKRNVTCQLFHPIWNYLINCQWKKKVIIMLKHDLQHVYKAFPLDKHVTKFEKKAPWGKALLKTFTSTTLLMSCVALKLGQGHWNKHDNSMQMVVMQSWIQNSHRTWNQTSRRSGVLVSILTDVSSMLCHAFYKSGGDNGLSG